MFGKLANLRKGVSIPSNKGTANLATTTMPLPKRIKVPMLQHIGAPAKPTVQQGDYVQVGTLIGALDGKISANMHSGVSGIVFGVEHLKTSDSKIVETVVIDTDGEQTISPNVLPPVIRDREDFLAAVEACGVVGLGGAGFPTAFKLNPPNLDEIDTLVINAAECEPIVCSDNRELLEYGDTILSGILATKKYLGIEKVVIGIERNKPEALDLMFSLTKGDPTLVVLPLSTRYPQGAEKTIIVSATGRVVPAGGLPHDIGVLVMNVTTVSTIGKFLIGGMPLVTRRITVDGGAVVEPKNLDVIIGTPISDVIEACGGYKFPPAKLLIGGPMMGIALDSVDYPITKQNNAVLALSQHDVQRPPVQPCIQCGRCVSTCPMGLSPVEINEAYELKDLARMKKLYSTLCINCGSCSYVCPAKRPVADISHKARNYCVQEGQK